jgi:hypothetical protein
MFEISRPAVLWTLLLCAVSAFGSDAQPSNILVGDLTFVRPKGWKWEAPHTNSVADSRFVISTVSKQVTDCRFYFTNDDWEHAKNLWTTQFSRRGQPQRIDEDVIKTSAGDLRFFTIDGDYALNSKHAIQSNFRLIGVMIPSAGKFVRTRVVGPIPEVEKATTAFKNMVIDTLKQRAEK